MSEQDAVTLDDLSPIVLTLNPSEGELRSCARCGCSVWWETSEKGDAQAAHERWHEAIEALTGTIQVEMPGVGPVTLSIDACATAAVEPSTSVQDQRQMDLVTELRRQVEAMEATIATREADVRRALGATKLVSWSSMMRMIQESRVEGFWPGEVDRLRKVENALWALGAPDRSERGDPGGLMVAWILERNAELVKLQAHECAWTTDQVNDRTRAQVEAFAGLLELAAEGREKYAETAPEQQAVVVLADEARTFRNAAALVRDPHCIKSHLPIAMWSEAPWLMTPDEEPGLQQQVTKPEPCPSLFLYDGQLYPCTHPLADHKQTGSGPAGDTWHRNEALPERPWTTDSDAVPSPWPVDQEPPPGINALRDINPLADEDDSVFTLRRHGDGWAWQEDGEPIQGLRGHTWAEATAYRLAGRLHVVLP